MNTSDLPYLPTGLRSFSPSWPPEAVEELKKLESGGQVNSGHQLSLAIARLRKALSLPPKAKLDRYARFFDQVMPKEESSKWFEEVVPTLGNLLLRLPSLLKTHYQNPEMEIDGAVVTTALRLVEAQESGIVFLSQELIAALLACSLFCLFPDDICRTELQEMNCGKLFAGVNIPAQKHKIWCIVHYFQRISSCMPKGIVSFERKVLPFKNDSIHITYPEAEFWRTSVVPLCKFKVHHSGGIEDQSDEAVEVDFADRYLGGIVLDMGDLQEEIRFVINPELIAGMLFLPAMTENEAIEIVGVERFSRYKGYASSFRFSGDYVDERDVDTFGRRKTRIVAIDALEHPGMSQYKKKSVLREINKAFCGFLFQCKNQPYQEILKENGWSSAPFDAATTSTSVEGKRPNEKIRISQDYFGRMDQNSNIGVATGNWGCGVFGGDHEIKTIIQWLAASQAQRPFIAYYTFGFQGLWNLEKVANWISSQKWTVGDLWEVLIKYSKARSKEETDVGFFQWLQKQ